MLGSFLLGWHRQGRFLSSRHCHQLLLLGSLVPEQLLLRRSLRLEQVVRGSDHVPFRIDFFQAHNTNRRRPRASLI